MANPYPAQFTDDNNRLRVDGSVTFTDSANQPGGSGPVTRVVVPISSAQILALKTTPVTLVAAPAAGFAIVSLAGVLTYTPGSTPYTVPGGAGFSFGWPAERQNYGSCGIDTATATFMGVNLWQIDYDSQDNATSKIDGQPFTIGYVTAPGPTLGNGTCSFCCTYFTAAL